MEDPPQFEIRVAFVGCEGTGKSTVLNALLGKQSIKPNNKNRSVNLFRILQPFDEANHAKIEEEDRDVNREPKRRRLEGTPNGDIKTSPRGDNNLLESTRYPNPIVSKEGIEKGPFAEQHFVVSLETQICQMRPDTQLVLIDIPGVKKEKNSRTSNVFGDYIHSKWSSFDCVVVVVDATSSHNTDEQIEFLRFVHKNNITQKDVPTIFLGNKIDDLEGTYQQNLLSNTTDDASNIYDRLCSDVLWKELKAMAKTSDCDAKNTRHAVFLAISAMNAFIHRRACDLVPENFHKKDAMDKLGQDEVGAKWKMRTRKEETSVDPALVKCRKECEERLKATNFHIFYCILGKFVGGLNTQKNLLWKQIDTSLKILSHDPKHKSMSKILHGIYKKARAVGRSTDDLTEAYWHAYCECEFESFEKVENEVNPKYLQYPLAELEDYHELASTLKWEKEVQKVVDRMKYLTHRLLRMIRTRMKTWSIFAFFREIRMRLDYDSKLVCKKPGKLSWTNLSPNDWIVILFSLSLSSKHMYKCCESKEGKQLAWIEESLLHFRSFYSPYITFQKTWLVSTELLQAAYKYIRALKTACDNDNNKDTIFKVKIENDMSDPHHWGHAAWKYCQHANRHHHKNE